MTFKLKKREREQSRENFKKKKKPEILKKNWDNQQSNLFFKKLKSLIIFSRINKIKQY